MGTECCRAQRCAFTLAWGLVSLKSLNLKSYLDNNEISLTARIEQIRRQSLSKQDEEVPAVHVGNLIGEGHVNDVQHGHCTWLHNRCTP